MAADERWYFTKEQLANTPSRKCGIDADKELSYRQQAANFIQDMGQRLMVTQLCINTAIVYMHRFYVFHSLTQFHRNAIAVAALFLAAKVEEQPRKLEHVIKMAYMCLHRDQAPPDNRSEFLEQAQDLVFNENVLLQTLGFDVAIDHPHTHVVRCCQLVKASKDLAQTSYFMASNSLHLTMMCLQYKPTVVACFCIHLACKWSNWEIPQSNEGKHWFWYVDKSVTSELLHQLTAEFLHIFDKCPSRLKKKIMSISANQSPNMHHPSLSNSPFRHSTSAQSREPSRDPNRQRLTRDYNASTSSSSSQSHAPVAHQSKDANLDTTDAASHKTDSTLAQDSASHSNPQKKPSSNNNYSVHRLNALDSKQAYDKRMHDPRHSKPVDHKKDNEQKAYSSKYPDLGRVDRQQRKQDTLEQRCEEVRKLIEKSLPVLSKPADASHTSKQAHHAKYNQISDKLQGGAVLLTPDMKHAASQSALLQDKVPNTVASGSATSQKTTSAKAVHNQHSAYGVSQILKDTIKNGSSQPCLTSANNADEPKSEKRPRLHDDSEKSSTDIQPGLSHQHTPPPSSRHRSLFSPETPTAKDPHAQRPKSKQKTPPSAAKIIKQERASPFASPPASQQQDSLLMKRPFNDDMPSSHKRPRVANISENEQPVKIKTEDTPNLEAMRMLGRVPELIQPIRDAPSNCSRNSTSSIVNVDLKPPEQLIKSFDSDPMAPRFSIPMAPHKTSSINVQTLTNGLDANLVTKQEHLEHHVKKEQSHRIPQAVCVKSEHPHPHLQQSKLEYFPMKSAQSISALLQEPLAPLPSLLQGVQQHQIPQQQLQQEQIQQSTHHLLVDRQPSMATQSLTIPNASDNVASMVSTVDMSALSCVPITHQENSVELASTSAPVIPLTTVASLEDKKSEHHKGEKKKKEKKHKHKDKEKSREKHKHKHKDKDKEKHREKDKEKSEETPTAAAPIKITIPKDKLNLSTETSPTVCTGAANPAADKNKSPHNTNRLKIKIPKERLKGAESVPSSPAQPVVQGPLKIKIRTDLGISRTSTTLTSPSGTSSITSGSHASFESTNETSRRRERAELTESAATINCPPTKKQSHISSAGYSQGHRPGERQNGRHYSSGSNNKVRGGGRGGRQYHGRGLPPLATGPYTAANQRSGDVYHQRDNFGSNQPRAQIPYPHQSLPAPRMRGDVTYARDGRIGQVGQTHPDPYFFANYPPRSVYNPAGYMYDPAFYQRYQQYQQQQQQAYSAMYPAGNVIITSDGAIDTSVPPPSMLPNLHHCQSAASAQQDTQSSSSLPPPPPPPPLLLLPPAPPLPIEPPPRFTPPPPPPPE